MSEMTLDYVPRLAPGCRLSTAQGQEDLLLIPEGALRLKGPARAIVELCNGERPMSEILQELKRRYASEDAGRIEAEAVAFVRRMRDRGVLETP
jgi:pyrroloquinoline quinone biosynthesis protein D